MSITKIPAKVKEITELCHDTKSFVLVPEKPISYKAGQFIMLNIPYKDTFVRRAYSIASMNHVEICLNYIPLGKASHYLFSLKGGEQIAIDGPYGIFKLRQSTNDKLFICTGTGVAPLRAMIQELVKNSAKESMTLIFGERTEHELLYRREFESLQKKHPRFTYVPTLSRENGKWKGESGYVQTIVQKYIKQPEKTDAYICGMKEMVDDTKKVLLQLGMPKEHILTEKFG